MGILTIANKAEFNKNVLESSDVTLVDFWASWCGPCKMLAPVIDSIANDYEGKAKFAKVNIDDCEDLAREYGVMSIPTLIVFKGGKAVQQTVGVVPAVAIEKLLNDSL